MKHTTRILIIGILSILIGGCSLFEEKPEQSVSIEKSEENEDLSKKNEPSKLEKDFSPSLTVRTLWKKRLGGGLEDYYLKLRPSVEGENLFITNRDGDLINVDIKSGKVHWKIKDKDVEYTSPAGLGDGMILVGTGDGRLIAREIESGTLRWIVQTSSEILAAPSAHKGITVVRSADGAVQALDSKTGSEVWNYRREAPRLTLRGNSRSLISDNVVFSALDNGRLIALDLKLGNMVWNKAITVP